MDRDGELTAWILGIVVVGIAIAGGIIAAG